MVFDIENMHGFNFIKVVHIELTKSFKVKQFQDKTQSNSRNLIN